jgi:hypothetical protein
MDTREVDNPQFTFPTLTARKNDTCAVLIFSLVPLLVHLPGLLGWWSVDPIHFVSRIASLHGKQILAGYPLIDPTVGTYAEALGKLSADEWLSGRIPWWNYYSGVGLPLAAEISSGAFFLPFVLLNHFSNGLLYIEVIIQILAGLGTYYLLRKIGTIPVAAITGAILYQFNGTFTWLGAPVSSVIPFLPWLIFGIENARERSLARVSGGWVIGAVSLAFSIYAGFPESAYINGLLAAVWSLWRLFGLPSNIRYRFIKKLATAVIVGLLLSMPVIAPFVEYCTLSYLGGHSFNAGYGGLRTEALPQLFFPWLYGGIFAHLDDSNVAWTVWATVGGYLSAAQLAVVASGLLLTRQRSLYIVLLAWILLSMGRTFSLPFLTTLVDFVPLLKLVAFYRYAPPSWEFCSAVLCAIAIDDICRGAVQSRRKFIFGMLLVLSIATITLLPARTLVRQLYGQAGYPAFLWLSLAWGLSTIAMVALVVVLAKDYPLLAGRATAILLTIDAITLFGVPSFSGIINGSQSPSAGVLYLKQHVGLDRFYTLGPIEPNYGAYYRVASINHNYLPIPANWVAYIKEHLDPYSDPVCFTGSYPRSVPNAPDQAEVLRDNVAQYKEIGVRYIVSPHSQNPFERTSSLSAMNSGIKPSPQPNEEPPPRVFESSDMDIYELSGTKPYFDVINGNCALKAENRSAVSVNCSSETLLTRRELYYPGWKAHLHGKSIPIERYNDIFQAIKIPPGQYRITFSYTPTHIRATWALFLLGVLWLTIATTWRWTRHRKRGVRVG